MASGSGSPSGRASGSRSGGAPSGGTVRAALHAQRGSMDAMFSRMRSPDTTASAGVLISEGPSDGSAFSRAIGMIESVKDLIPLIPVDYRDALGADLTTFVGYRLSLDRCQNTLARIKEEARDGVPALARSISAPTLQLARVFEVSSSDIPIPTALQRLNLGDVKSTGWNTFATTIANEARALVVTGAIAFLEAEIDWFAARTVCGFFYENTLGPNIEARYQELAAVRKDFGSVQYMDEQGRAAYRWTARASESLKTARDEIHALMAQLLTQADSIGRRQVESLVAKRNAKREIVKDTDVDMPDTQTSDQRIAELEKQLKAITAAKKARLRTSSSLDASLTSSTAAAYEEGGSVEGQEEGRRRQGWRCQTHEQACPGRQGGRQEVRFQEERLEHRWHECQSAWEAAGEVMLDASWSWKDSDSYPDCIVTCMPRSLAVLCILSRMPANTRAALSYRHPVHVLPGVNPPRQVLADLSIGIRYSLPTRFKPNLVMKAWTDFDRRVRWGLHFAMNPMANPSVFGYVSDWEVNAPKDARLPTLPTQLSRGLDMARALVETYSQTSLPMPSQQDRLQNTLAPPLLSTVHTWIQANDAIASLTDKNLGVAVISKEWYIEETSRLLNDERSYRRISIDRVIQDIEDDLEAVWTLIKGLETAFPNIRTDEKQLMQFLEEPTLDLARKYRDYYGPAAYGEIPGLLRWTLVEHRNRNHDVWPDVERFVPTFYGIPKIHKTPWRMRPIMPCHSVIAAHPLIVLQHFLKPVVKAQPYVFEGTKDLILKLSAAVTDGSLKCDAPDEHLYICTGDVVAMYPNVPLDRAHQSVQYLWQKYRESDIGREIPPLADWLVDKLLLFACRDEAYLQFNGTYYEQIRGLAMGIHTSPDIANLYAAHAENTIVPNVRGLKFYGRFIDDVFALVSAPSLEEARRRVSAIRFPGLELDWDVSPDRAVFLDVRVFWSYTDQHIGWRPYVKPFNHMERMPWISPHPAHIKRASFIGELSRMALLSSDKSIFRESAHALAAVYADRGYPKDLIKQWLKQHADERWIARLAPRVQSRAENPLVIKSEFNPAWHSFPIKDVENILHREWSAYRPTLEDELPEDPDVDGLAIEHSRNPWVGPASAVGPIALGKRKREEASAFTRRLKRLRADDSALVQYTERPVMLSRKRTLNLMDLTHIWRNNTLRDPDQWH